MQVIVGTRNRDEADILPTFLANFPFASKIVIADGGSTDNSKELALKDPRVLWYDFPERVPGKNGGWRNPEGRHMRFLLDRCEELVTDADDDWLWITETDAFPNLNLQRDALSILEDLNLNSIKLFMSWLCYVAPDGISHYPKTMQGPGYTAWKKGMAKVNITATGDLEGQGNLAIPQDIHYAAPKEQSRIHLTWETESLIDRKDAFYREIHGWIFEHPDVRFGPRVPFPSWAQWNEPRNASGIGGYEHPRD